MNERAKYKLIGFIMMFASSSLMGGIGAFTRFIDAPGDFVSFWRNFAGLIALSIIFLFIGGFKKVKTTRFSGTMLLSGIFLGLLSGLYCLSTQYTTLANASFLIYTGPIYSTVLAAIFLKEKIDWKGILCIVAVVVGMLFIVGIVTPEGLTLDLDPAYTFGNAIALASGVAYGLYLFFSRYREDCDSNVRSWWNFLFASLAILVLLLWHNFFLQPLPTPRRWAASLSSMRPARSSRTPGACSPCRSIRGSGSSRRRSSPVSARSICSPMPLSA